MQIMHSALRETRPLRRPPWLQKPRTLNDETHGVSKVVTQYRLHSVCHEAKCPNLAECYGRGITTFLLMGNVCTRSCKFCQIGTRRRPSPLDSEEPLRVAMAVRDLGLSHVVLTSVTRDDLEDEGAAHFVETIRQCRQLNPKTRVEVLTPDFHAREDVFEKLRAAPPDIFNHNLETVERLQNKIRPLASWTTSLKCLALARKVLGSDTLSKTGIMVGLGETDEEVVETMRACAEQNIDIFNVGQYLQPSRRHMAPKRYVHPDVFEGYREEGMKLGFKYVFSGPYVRSSYMADHQTTHSFPEFP